jgi:uncharacterized membrane protein
VICVGHDAEVFPSPSVALLPMLQPSIGRKVLTSVAILAVTGGLMGLATFGSYDDAHDTITRSTIGDPQS